ncbi:deoxyinosine 3'endonuclease (endonuclease V) [Marinitoga piezophila KA3]|uniref:Endonuclease V n=1 Tax=Marinitoga piezophila (strain DSM 14283 / JCM 11233 / KA3) TaxID=443254 RepID=H2J877_MARPK|nr:deoxyinosine 3'endonuclease (endonuclease V) [Marinitoga piezophila KA3]
MNKLDYNHIHDFIDLDYKKCINIQKSLINQISLIPLSKEVNVVAGVDLSFYKEFGLAIIVIIDKNFNELEVKYHYQEIEFPYIPGLLAFRELPVFLNAWKKVTIRPDIVFFDGHGIAHPRKMGIATHASFFIEIPTIGIAKSKLYGNFDEPGNNKGDYSYIYDKKDKKIGCVIRTREKTKPVFVSPGNFITIDEARYFALKFSTRYKLPEPTRLAHYYSQKIKNEIFPRRNANGKI